jgi:uncharacterized membrane protein
MAETKQQTTKNSKDTVKTPDQKNEENIDQVKVMAALAYLGILFFLPLVTNPESKFGKFHANQGLLLLLTAIILNTVGTIIPIIGWFIIIPLGNLFTLVLFVMGLVNALGSKMTRLPLIGNYDLIK